jgi:amino acid permease
MSADKSLEYEKNDVVDSTIVSAQYEPNEVEFGGERKQTHRQLKPRHVQLIAISGAIGTGLFVCALSPLLIVIARANS